jgi:hypothetical protein
VVRTSLLRSAVAGLLLGAAWGVLARIWMRLISDDPEFTWSGTLAIIGLSAVLGLGVGLVHAARQSGRTRWWTLAVVPGLLLFMSPGMLMAPAFLLGGLTGSGRGRVARIVGMIAILASVVLATWVVLGGLDGSGPTDVGLVDVLVYEGGYVLLVLGLAAGSALVWRRTRPTPDLAAVEGRLRAAAT